MVTELAAMQWEQGDAEVVVLSPLVVARSHFSDVCLVIID